MSVSGGAPPADLVQAALARMRYDPMGYVPPIWADEQGLREKVCIVGFAGSTRDEAPFQDRSFEFWGMNRAHEVFDYSVFTRWFQIHQRSWWDTPARAKSTQWMRTCPMPLYLHQVEPDMPTSIAYPRAAIEAAFNRYLPELPGGQSGLGRNRGEPYYTNSVTWMMALAVLEGFKEVHVYGVDMVTDEEYGYQRPNCDYWLGLLAGLGIKTVVPKDSALCTQEWLYGYGDRPQDQGLLSDTVLTSRQKGLALEQQKAEAAALVLRGHLEEIQQLKAILKHHHRGGKTGLKASLAMGQARSLPAQPPNSPPPGPAPSPPVKG